MATQRVDLTGGDVILVGNKDDNHLLRLKNPVGQDLIVPGGLYEADFSSSLGAMVPIPLDVGDLVHGYITMPVTIQSGTYRVRRLNPRRTIVKIEVSVK